MNPANLLQREFDVGACFRCKIRQHRARRPQMDAAIGVLWAAALACRQRSGVPRASPALWLYCRPAARKAQQVELRLRVKAGEGEAEQIVWVRPDFVDLTDHKTLVELPEELLACAGRMWALAVRSTLLKAMPAGLGAFTGMQSLILHKCSGLTALPAGLGALTVLQRLDLSHCSGLTALL